MNRLEGALERKAEYLIPYIMCGDPDLEMTREIIRILAEEGVLAIELGVPFSDPVADGPVIQAAGERALKNRVTLNQVLELGKKVREDGIDVPLILFSYANPVFHFGMERLVHEAVAHGFDGIIVPDLPYEESVPLRRRGSEAGLSVISLVAPTSRERIKDIVSSAQGFVYCVSSLGTTGMRREFSEQTETFLDTVRMLSPVPTAIGFGISGREHVEHFLDHADAVVVGSALVQKIEKLLPYLADPAQRENALAQLRQFVRGLKSE
ncbi:tryptophan synthase subunit alpha [Thermoactinomyces mirandus]|uniref:Tryptophan synthase alpha chain n=1 Tax=Thermoactinomyces mirandus TaxID=2756294 RepID=A0A7W2ARM9_9BACL|nr:tryptophan synthase subunit alpha [Thermoactinomyces mirandus]MBA4602557.1 tryptophan synthase subunit alpha [Thermoactinomyces mirandus]